MAANDNGRTWPRFNLFEAGPRVEADELSSTRQRLQKASINETLRRDIDRYLKRLADKPALLSQLFPRKGRPPSTIDKNMALHYAVLYALNGRGGSEDARKDVAYAWNKSRATVKAANTKHGRAARARMERMVASYLGKSIGERAMPDGRVLKYPAFTRKSILVAMEADLDDMGTRSQHPPYDETAPIDQIPQWQLCIWNRIVADRADALGLPANRSRK